MLHGYGHVKSLCKDLQAFMSKHSFTSIKDFRGYISYNHLVVITWAFCVQRTVSLLFLVPRLADLKPIAFFLNNLLLKMAFEEVSDRFLLPQQHWIHSGSPFEFFGVRARILQTLLIISYSLFECEPTAGLSLPIAYRNVTGRLRPWYQTRKKSLNTKQLKTKDYYLQFSELAVAEESSIAIL